MIEVRDLVKTFRCGRGQVAALDGLTFHVAPGATFVVQGPSGSGKTTLLNCLGGLERPDAGKVVCDGIDLGRLAPRQLSAFQRRRLGFVFQAGNLIPYLTVRENLALPLELNGVQDRTLRQRVEALLAAIGLADAGGSLPRELSGGEVQRVACARAMAHEPAVLLADEPTASLDSQNAQRLMGLMTALGKACGTTLVIATHDPDISARADAVLWLRDGRRETRDEA